MWKITKLSLNQRLQYKTIQCYKFRVTQVFFELNLNVFDPISLYSHSNQHAPIQCCQETRNDKTGLLKTLSVKRERFQKKFERRKRG